MILLVARTPDTVGSPTWWEAGSANADYARDLIRTTVLNRYNIDPERIWLVGYSGGAQFITRYFLPKYSSMIGGGGSVVFGGGGTPAVTVQPFASGFTPDFPMYWYTGGADNGTCPGHSYNALADAQRGSAYYRGRGFTTGLETPAGVCHGLSGRFGTVVGQQLDRYDR
jgi:poly(3-hydroxybutyrate) depolymerase